MKLISNPRIGAILLITARTSPVTVLPTQAVQPTRAMLRNRISRNRRTTRINPINLPHRNRQAMPGPTARDTTLDHRRPAGVDTAGGHGLGFAGIDPVS